MKFASHFAERLEGLAENHIAKDYHLTISRSDNYQYMTIIPLCNNI